MNGNSADKKREETENGSLEKLALLCSYEDAIQGEAIRGLLEDGGVRVLLESFEDNAYDGIFIPQRGAGRIMVFAADLARARELLRKSDLSPGAKPESGAKEG